MRRGKSAPPTSSPVAGSRPPTSTSTCMPCTWQQDGRSPAPAGMTTTPWQCAPRCASEQQQPPAAMYRRSDTATEETTMNIRRLSWALCLSALVGTAVQAEDKQPNFLIILADDLGY